MSDRARLSAWLALSRAPNLLTVPGDPAAGFLLAVAAGAAPIHAAAMGWAGLSSLFLYLAGLYLNDLCDAEEDARDRPFRPLPSGRITRVRARAAMAAAMALGLLCAGLAGLGALAVAAALLASICLYNLRSKRSGVAGPLNMGLCRGLSLLLGAAAAGRPGDPAVLAAALTLALYIAEVTRMARHETEPQRLRRSDALMPAVVLAIGLVAVAFMVPGPPPLAAWAAATSGLCALAIAAGLGRQVGRLLRAGEWVLLKERLPSAIGLYISALLFLQAGLIVAAGLGAASWVPGSALVFLWPINRRLGRRFHAS